MWRLSALPGGQPPRMALARAIVAEPLSNLGSQLRASLCDEIGGLRAHGRVQSVLHR